ncbi:MAG: efflux RND transporter periplasmic adaptor subunit, partial [Persicimonas sp.]
DGNGDGHEHGNGDEHEHGNGDEHGDESEHEHGNSDGHGGEAIEFSSEQQGMVDFKAAEVKERGVRSSVPAPARLRAASDAAAAVESPFDGRLSGPDGAIPGEGARVESGQVVAYVEPKVSSGDATRLETELRKAKARLERAEREVARAEKLVEAGAAPKRRLEEARTDRALAEAEIEQAERNQNEYRQLDTGAGGGRVAIRSPLDGVVVGRTNVDGAYVSSGEAVVEVVDRGRVWLEAHVSQANLEHLGEPAGASFDAPGGSSVEVGADQLVSVGDVDPETRSAPMLFELDEPPEGLRIGSTFQARVFADDAEKVLTVPRSSVLEEKGIDVVFVVTGRESFERRRVRTGRRDGDFVEIERGLDRGDLVVAKGAYHVKLAGSSSGSAGHGHTH